MDSHGSRRVRAADQLALGHLLSDVDDGLASGTGVLHHGNDQPRGAGEILDGLVLSRFGERREEQTSVERSERWFCSAEANESVLPT